MRFVVHKHAARQLHFDLRLDWNGVMKSWAVPKGPSLDPQVRRLAIEVEDHPIAYNGFEGRIAAGQYGAGTVMLWDRGSYSAAASDAEDPHAVLRHGFAGGRLAIVLRGERLRGAFLLVRTRWPARGGPQWLLSKEPDSWADAGLDPVRVFMTSVASGRTMEEIARDG